MPPVGGSFEFDECLDEAVFYGVNALEDEILIPFLAHLIAQVFHGIEFRRVGRQGKKTNAFGHCQRLGGVPTRSVQHKNNELVGVTPKRASS